MQFNNSGRGFVIDVDNLVVSQLRKNLQQNGLIRVQGEIINVNSDYISTARMYKCDHCAERVNTFFQVEIIINALGSSFGFFLVSSFCIV